MKTSEFSFINNFNKLTFARFFSLNLSSKSSWRSLVEMKFEPYNLHHCKKKLPQVSFRGIFRTTTLPHNFRAAALLEVALVKKYNKPLS